MPPHPACGHLLPQWGEGSKAFQLRHPVPSPRCGRDRVRGNNQISKESSNLLSTTNWPDVVAIILAKVTHMTVVHAHISDIGSTTIVDT